LHGEGDDGFAGAAEECVDFGQGDDGFAGAAEEGVDFGQGVGEVGEFLEVVAAEDDAGVEEGGGLALGRGGWG